jgi:Ca-activated chloride channel homolog
MKYFRFLLLIVFLPIVVAGRSAVVPQQIEINVDRVNILFSVKDNKGKLVTNLTQADFKLYEDEKPQTIERLNIDRDLPLNIALLIDRSGTVQNQLKLEKDAAIEFLNKTLKHGKDRALVIGFDTGVDDLSQGFTDDIEKLSAPIRKILAGGSTAVFDAVYIASSQYLSKEPSRRVIVLISDGDDNNSRKTLDEAMLASQKSDVAIYAISTNLSIGTSGADRDKGDKTLKRLSQDTGGRAFFPKKLEDLETGFQSIGEEVRSQYSLIYSPTNKVRDGLFRRYRVVPNNKQYKVTAPPGYYAPSGR